MKVITLKNKQTEELCLYQTLEFAAVKDQDLLKSRKLIDY